jgi:GGDEF domain-containing protein
LLGIDKLDVDQYISHVCGLAVKNDQKSMAAQLCRMAKTCLPVSFVDQVGRNEFTFLLESNHLEKAFSSAVRIQDQSL